jgi:hypothetical protein
LRLSQTFIDLENVTTQPFERALEVIFAEVADIRLAISGHAEARGPMSAGHHIADFD